MAVQIAPGKRDGDSGHAAAVIGWSMWVLSSALVAAVVVAMIRQLTVRSGWWSVTNTDIFFLASFLAVGAVGALIVSRRPRGILGWLFCLASLLWSSAIAGYVYAGYIDQVLPVSKDGTAPVGELAVLCLACSLLLFPEGGTLPSAARRPFTWVVGGAIGAYVLTQVLHSGSLQSLLIRVGTNSSVWGSTSPVLRPLLGLTASESVLVGMLALAAVTALLRLPLAHGIERQQLKWFAFAGILPVAGVGIMVFHDWDMGYLVLAVGVAAQAVAVGIAILRYRLYDIDIIINRTLVYGSVTAVLAGVFAALSIVTQRVVLALTGQESQAAVVLAALVVTALFQPLRARVQVVVDRRFYRRKYDTAQTLERFASQVRDKVELDQLTTELVAVVRETMQPSHASLWLRPLADARSAGIGSLGNDRS